MKNCYWSFFFSMKFSISKKVKPVITPPLEEEEEETESKQGPFDYMKARIDSQVRQAKLDAFLDVEEVIEEKVVVSSGPSGVPSSSGPLGSRAKPMPPKPILVSQPGLVMMDPTKDPTIRREAKHIAKMKETSQVNETFKNLLKVKIADREKILATDEFGSAPEEIITGAYRKQKEASLQLEKELVNKEGGKSNVSNLFREMLGSGSYSRTNYHQPQDVLKPTTTIMPGPEPIVKNEANELEITKKILEKIGPTPEVTRAINERAKLDVLKIVEQISHLEDNRAETRLSAKERYLARKKAKIE